MEAAVLNRRAPANGGGCPIIVHWLFGLGMAAVIVATYLAPNPDVKGWRRPESARLVVFHVPCHWVAFLAFFSAMLFAIRFLMKRNLEDDLKSCASAEIGLLFATLGTLTGGVFGGQQWSGTWFYMDFHEIRVISILILLLTYAAYFALRSAIEDEDQRATVSSVYAVIGFIGAVFLIFVLPRIKEADSLHPTNRNAYRVYNVPFFGALITYTWLYFWIWSMRVRIGRRQMDSRAIIEYPVT
jgi:heme exporter protein C